MGGSKSWKPPVGAGKPPVGAGKPAVPVGMSMRFDLKPIGPGRKPSVGCGMKPVGAAPVGATAVPNGGGARP